MSNSVASSTPPTPEKALHKLFLTLFLRGRSSRGLQRSGAPRSVGSKLGLMLGVYAMVGMGALIFVHHPVFTMSLCLHATTLAFLGMFVAASSGEILFNKEESDILLHRPVTPRALLWAKIGVLLRVSLWLAGAFNLVCFFAGIEASDGGWLFPLAHVLSTVMEAFFCAGTVVVVYQLCLRWFGREKLESLMTMAQIAVAIGAVLAGQIPQFFGRMNGNLDFNVHVWWIYLLPPAWFAGVDDSLAGSHALISVILAVVGLIATAGITWLAFGKLAQDYETGMQSMGEARGVKRSAAARRRWLDALVQKPPLRWWLRDPVSRASFLLITAYLLRDRDVKLRIYPGIAPMLVWPVIMLINAHRSTAGGVGMLSGFSIAFAGIYLGIIPLLAVDLLRYSQQWQAADLFRVAPMPGPGPLWDGARRAVLCVVTVPVIVALAIAVLVAAHGGSNVMLLIPGIIALPAYAVLACINGSAAPLSLPTESAKAAGRAVSMMVVMMVSAVLALLSTLAWNYGLFVWMLLLEVLTVGALYYFLRRRVSELRWTSLE